MYETMQSKINKFHIYAARGMYEQCREQAEELIRSNPEDPIGYLLMARYSYLVQIHEDVITWCDEALLRGPEDLMVLETVTSLHQSIQCDREKRIELVETGLRVYPYNGYFHIHYALLHEGVNNDQAKASYEEAICLNPHHEQYLGNYARFLNKTGNWKEAEQFEQLALQENPESVGNLFQFAINAYENRRYQKAQMLMEKVIRLKPDSYWIREYYKEIYPTKHGIVRAKLQLNHSLLTIWKYSSKLLWKLLSKKVPLEFCMFMVLVLGFVAMTSLFGVYMLILASGYILLLVISMITSTSMLKAAGLTDEEEVTMKRKTRAKQQAALKKMEKKVAKNKKASVEKQESSIPQGELEVQLAQIWDSDSIAAFKKQAKDEEPPQQKAYGNEQPVPIDWPKDHSNWPIYVIGIIMIIMAVIRFIPATSEQVTNQSESASLEELEDQKEELIEHSKEMKNQESITPDLNISAINIFIQVLEEDNPAEELSELVAEDYKPIIQENINHPLFKELAGATADKFHQSIAVSYFLLENDQKNTQAVVEVMFGEIKHIYAENWDESEEEEFQRLLGEIEKNGKLLEE